MIDTERTILRPFNKNDFDIIFGLYANDKIMMYMPNDIMTEEQAQNHLNQIVNDWQAKNQTNFEMAIIDKKTNKKIGRTRISLDLDSQTAMIGWLLLESYWGKGYATEITRALLTYSFDVLNVHRVSALCHPNNAGSRHVLEKNNLRQEAYYVKKAKYIKKGTTMWQDEVEYAILDSEFNN